MNSFEEFRNLTTLLESALAVAPIPDLIDQVQENLARQRKLHVEAIYLFTEMIVALGELDFTKVRALIDEMEGVNLKLHEHQ